MRLTCYPERPLWAQDEPTVTRIAIRAETRWGGRGERTGTNGETAGISDEMTVTSDETDGATGSGVEVEIEIDVRSMCKG